MNSSNTNNLTTFHHLKNLKQQYNDRKLIHLIIDLIKFNDHDTLAFISRTYGIPPQLRHVVWPILLKYHPMCISPNIVSNSINWDSNSKTYKFIQPFHKRNRITNNTPNSNNKHSKTSNSNEDLEFVIIHDLKKYFHSRTNHRTTTQTTGNTTTTASNSFFSPLNNTSSNTGSFNTTASTS